MVIPVCRGYQSYARCQAEQLRGCSELDRKLELLHRESPAAKELGEVLAETCPSVAAQELTENGKGSY